MACILRVPNTSNYVADAATMKFGYRYEAKHYDDYEKAFEVAVEVMDRKKNVQIEIEEVLSCSLLA